MLIFQRSDADVVRAVRSGQPERFAVLVSRYFRDLHAVAFAYTRNQADAEDIAQETFLRAFSNLEQLREPQQFRHWLLSIARNHAHQLWRERQRESALPTLSVPPLDPVRQIEREEQRRLLAQHLDALEPDQREVLLLHYFAGRSTREIAVLLDVQREAVKKRLERARAALGASLLQDLAIAPDKMDTRKNVQKVMAAVLALPLARAATAAAPAGLATAALLPKAAMVLAAAVLGAVILLAFDRVSTSARPQAPPAADTAAKATPQPPVAAPNRDLAELTVSRDRAAAPTEPPSNADCGNAETLAAFAATKPEAAARVWTDKDLEEPVNMEFDKIALKEVLGFLNMQWKLPFYLDETVPKVAHGQVTTGMIPSLEFKNTTVREALELICEPLGLAFVIEPGFVWVSTPAYIQREVKPAPAAWYEAYDLESSLEHTLTGEFQDLHVAEVLNFISMQGELNIMLDWRVVGPMPEQSPSPIGPGGVPLRAGAFPGAPPGAIPLPTPTTAQPPHAPVPFEVVYFNAKNVKLRDALHVLLRPLDLTYQVKPYGVVISAASQLNSFTPRPVLGAPSETLSRALEAPFTLKLEKTTVQDCLNAVRSATGLCIQAGKAADESLGRTISGFEIDKIPLAAALSLISLQADQPFLLTEETLYVGAKSVEEVTEDFAPIPAGTSS